MTIKNLLFSDDMADAAEIPESVSLYAIMITPMRFAPYKSNSQQYKNGLRGRFQIWNGFGFENVAPDELNGWIDQPGIDLMNGKS